MIKNDFEPIRYELSGQKNLNLIAVADVHSGAIESNLEGWERFNQLILNEPNTYIIIVGDMMNNAIKSSVSNCFEETMRPRDQKIYLKEKLTPLAEAGKILAIVPGNHEKRSIKEVDDAPLYDVACKLDLENVYRENLAIVDISIGSKKNPNCYVIVATHGDGSGGMTGSVVNKYERFASYWNGVDVFFFGHSHKPFITKPNKMAYDSRLKLAKKKEMVIMTTPSWLEYGGYPVKKLMPPVHDMDPKQPMFLTLGGKRRHRFIKTNW